MAVSKKIRDTVLKQTMSPREQYVLEAPEGYVIRKKLPRDQFHEGKVWWTSPIVDHEMIKYAAENVDYTHLFYAVRTDQNTGEKMLALVTREQIAGGISKSVKPMAPEYNSVRNDVKGLALTILTLAKGASDIDMATAIGQAVAEYLSNKEQARELDPQALE